MDDGGACEDGDRSRRRREIAAEDDRHRREEKREGGIRRNARGWSVSWRGVNRRRKVEGVGDATAKKRERSGGDGVVKRELFGLGLLGVDGDRRRERKKEE
ncbi:hypothetical protein L484_004351 [Morus notabilis]|uniref:Uncharacterized protein n=1 Tax=Morus notabilis TaxID=981085 RepID=W9QIK1_9ROSA|nr:hypothetical protein L484_004351 [Morus notabilis]